MRGEGEMHQDITWQEYALQHVTRMANMPAQCYWNHKGEGGT